MDLEEFYEEIKEWIEKEDRASQDIETKKEIIRKICEFIVKKRRERVEIHLYAGAKVHKIIFHSNSIIELDGQKYDLSHLPDDFVTRIEMILSKTSDEDMRLKSHFIS